MNILSNSGTTTKKKASTINKIVLGVGVIIGIILGIILNVVIVRLTYESTGDDTLSFMSTIIAWFIEVVLIGVLIYITLKMEINTLNYFLNGVYMGLGGPAFIKIALVIMWLGSFFLG